MPKAAREPCSDQKDCGKAAADRVIRDDGSFRESLVTV